MSNNIDQFGRINKDFGNNEILDNQDIDQSKKIKESLAEIKEQLINENFKIQVNEDLSSSKEKTSSKLNNSSIKIKELENKINNIESEFRKEINNKLNSIDQKISNLNNFSSNERKNSNIQKLENNIFSEIDNQIKPLTSNAILVINKKSNKEIKSPLIKIIYLIFTLILIYILSIDIMLLKDPDLNNINIFGKEYLFKFLELINYI